MTATLDSIEAVQETVRHSARVLPMGGGSKPALSLPSSDDVLSLDMSSLRGMVEYDPDELTFTALAGTPVSEISAALAERGQYLPFDPPWSASGATLGGVVAAGTSGANAFRHGGIRDFVIGVRFVEGSGRLVSGGGKVVKNAAGFDLPKLMVGSIGRLGVIVQLSLKVFPQPPATVTVVFEIGSVAEALEAMSDLARGPLDLDALDLVPPGRLLVRLGGSAETLSARAARLIDAVAATAEQLEGHRDAAHWHDAAEFTWASSTARIVRVALSASSVPALEAALAPTAALRRYSLGANLVWIAWPDERPLLELDAILETLGLAGMVLTGPPDRQLLGALTGGSFAARIRSALDPHNRFAAA